MKIPSKIKWVDGRRTLKLKELSDLDEREKIAYLKALVFIATIDEKLGDAEKKYLVNIGNAYGLDKAQTEELISVVLERTEELEDILSSIEDRKIKLLLLYELLAFCYVDGSYADKAKAGIINVANCLGIETDKVREIESVLIESIQLQDKINKILER